MQKALFVVIIFLVISLILIFMFIFLPLGLFSNYSSCASFGVSKLTESEINELSNTMDQKSILLISDDDLREVPKFLDLIHRVSNKIDYEHVSYRTVSSSEMYQYHKILGEKHMEQKGYELNRDKTVISLDYNKITYVFTVSNFPKYENSSGTVDFSISKIMDQPYIKIKLEDIDFKNMEKIKDAIDSIGTKQSRSYESVGMSEPEWNQYRNWFGEGFAEGYSYFKYQDKIYSPSFGIC